MLFNLQLTPKNYNLKLHKIEAKISKKSDKE